MINGCFGTIFITAAGSTAGKNVRQNSFCLSLRVTISDAYCSFDLTIAEAIKRHTLAAFEARFITRNFP